MPPMFFGSNPEVLNLNEYLEKTKGAGKHKDGVRGQIAEQIMFNALKKHYEKSEDDVLIVQSHKFLNSVSSNEKDFLLVNVTKGYTMALEVKASASQYQTAKKQLFDAKDRIEELYAAIGLTKGQLISEAIFLGFKSPKNQIDTLSYQRVKVALSQKILKNFFIAKINFQITILSRKFE